MTNFVSYKFNTEEGSHTVGLWEENYDGEMSDVLYDKDFARFIEDECSEDRFWECIKELTKEAHRSMSEDTDCSFLCIDNRLFYCLLKNEGDAWVPKGSKDVLACEGKSDNDNIKFVATKFWDRYCDILSREDFLSLENFIEEIFGDYNEKSVNYIRNKVFYDIMHDYFREGWNSNDSRKWTLSDKNLWKAFDLLDRFYNFDFIDKAYLTIGDKIFCYANR